MVESICCHSCGANEVAVTPRIGQFVPVSSDIRLLHGRLVLGTCQACGLLQKIVDTEWQEAVGRIYDDYDINHQSGGSDPYIFNSEYGPGPRAAILMAHLSNVVSLTDEGRMLDIGCASGNILRSFGARHPGWSLHGIEKSHLWHEPVSAIPGVRGFYTDLDALGDLRFDLIVMSHVLEHIPDPASYLNRLRKYLTKEGALFIAVPDIRQNPVDLFVLDHCTHFDEATLHGVLTRSKLRTLDMRSNILGKEIVALCRDGNSKQASVTARSHATPLSRIAEKYCDLCEELLACARRTRAAHANFGVMGTSTAAAWIAGELAMQVEFFVDEDPQRVGKTAFGKPILSLAQVPVGACVFIPMSSSTARGIITRAARSDITLEYYASNQIEA